MQAQSVEQKADELMIAYTKQQKFSGNVLIAIKNHIVFTKSYGYASQEDNKLNMGQTEFRVGSLTKMFTAVLIMQLMEEKKLSLTDKLSGFVKGIDPTGKVTIQHLLSHTSGLKRRTKPGAATLEQMIAGYKSKVPAFMPGERFEYNNFNFILLSFIAQKLTGKKYSELVKTRMLHKAGMMHSGIDYSARKSADKASGYVTDPTTNTWVLTGTDSTVLQHPGQGHCTLQRKTCSGGLNISAH